MMNTVTNLRFRNIGITLLLLLVLFVLARFWLRPSPHIRKRANVAFKAPGDDAKNVALKDGALPQHEEVDKPIYVAPKPPADNPNMMQRLLDQLPNFGGDPDSEEALFEFQDDLPNVPIPPPSKEEFNEKWIVITTINKPTEDVKQLAAIKGWNMVIVADTKTPTDYDTLFEHGDNVHFLSVEEQESPSLDYSIKEHVPWKVYGRKNLGYLYAIQRGAKVIYETDDDNHPTDGMESFCINSTTWTGMIVNTSNHNYNPYAFFGQTSLWPRGFQLDFVSKPNKNRFRLCTMKAPAVQQGVVNGDPDMGAMFRLTRKIETRIINVTFDYASPPFSYPQNVFSPYNSQNTVSLYTAFWGLLMPNTVTFRVTDIWRSYFTTRLLWLLNERVAFSPPSAFQLRSAHSYLVDASQEPDLYFKTEAFLQFLSGWDCDGGRLFRECIVMLAMDMAMHEKKFWGVKDVRFIMAWLSDLERIGYKFPERANLGNTTAVCEQTTILYHAREQKTSFPSTTSNQLIPSTSHVAREAKVLSEVCPALNVGIGKLASSDLYTSLYPASKTGLEDVLLIVRVRSAHVTGMAALDTFYRRDFYQIVFCVEEKMLEDAAKLNRSVITIPDSSDPLLDFKCVTTAILMKYRVTGYLYLDSETLLRYWAAADLPKDKLWVDDASVNSIPEVKVGDSCLNDPLTNPDAAKSFPNFKVLYVPQSVASTVINLSTPFKDVSAMRVNFYKAIACHHKKDINQVVLVSKQDPTKLEPPTTTAPTTTPQQQPQQQQPQQQQQQQPQQQQAQQQQPQQQQAQQQQAQQQQPQQQQAQQQQQPQQQQVDKANQGGETKVEPVKEESVKTRRLLAVESPKQSLQYEIFNFQEVGSNPKVKEIYCFLIDSTTVKS